MRQRLCAVSLLAVLLVLGKGIGASQKQPTKAKGHQSQTVDQQIATAEEKLAKIEDLLRVPGVKDDKVLGTVLVQQWTTLSCHAKRLQAGQLLGELATKDILDRVEKNCVLERQPEAEQHFLGVTIKRPLDKDLHIPEPFPTVKDEKPKQLPSTGAVKSSPGGLPDFTVLSSSSESKRAAAIRFPIKSDSIVLEERNDDKACKPKDKLCVTLDWQQKSPTTMPLRKSGDFTFHAINLNDILYQYTMTGEAPTPATDDLSLFADLIKKVQSNLLPAAGTAKAADTKLSEVIVTKCAVPELAINLADGKAQLGKLSQALSDLQPQAQDKKYPSISLGETNLHVKALVDSFNLLAGVVIKLQGNLNNPDIGGGCEDSVAAASDFITDQYPKIRGQVEKLRDRYNQSHTLDQLFHCEQTIGCSMSIQESYAGTLTAANPNPWKSTQQATLSQLTVSGGFLLTTLQARSYSSRTAPDPAAPTTKTVNVLGVDDGSGVRPALTALLNYHLPFSFTDWPKGGFALSAGPVIDVSNGKADTSRFGFFGGVSAHLWNRFWITPGVHVGEFADTPQGFKGAGDIIPPNIGTPTPVKRFTARFAVAITFQGGSPTALVGDKKPDTSKDATPAPGNGKSTTPGKN